MSSCTSAPVAVLIGCHGRLDVRTSDGQIKHEHRNCQGKNQSRRAVPERYPADAMRFAYIIGKRGTQGTGHDVGEPEAATLFSPKPFQATAGIRMITENMIPEDR